MKIKQDFKYKILKNFLTKEETSLLKDYTVLSIRHNDLNFNTGQSSGVPNLCIFSDPIMESLMLQKRIVVQEEIGLELLPTYTYWRAYTKFSDLPKHKDRPSCEISVTVNIGSDGTSWPIFMDGVPLELNPGDGAVYLGCEVEHWREEFKGDWCSQVFLHYVDKNGPYKSHYKDQRIHFGLKEKYAKV